MNRWPNGRLSDRMLEMVVTVTGGAALYLLREWLMSMRSRRKAFGSNLDVDEAIRVDTDELYSVRYSLLEKVHHTGSCHCRRVRFRIRAPRVLNAFDIHSKVRYPRIVIRGEDFENLTDEALLSLYPVTNNNGNSIAIHAFCSCCGVHVLYAPSEDPKEVQINVDCLDVNTIEKVNISYYGTSDLVSCSLSDNRAKVYSRKGNCGIVPSSAISNFSDAESLSDLQGVEPVYLTNTLGKLSGGRASVINGSRNLHLDGAGLDEALVFVEESELGLDGNSETTGMNWSPCGSTPHTHSFLSPPIKRDHRGIMEDASDHSGSGTTTQSSASGRYTALDMSGYAVSEGTPTTALHKRLRTHLYRHLHSQTGRSDHSSGSDTSSGSTGHKQRTERNSIASVLEDHRLRL